MILFKRLTFFFLFQIEKGREKPAQRKLTYFLFFFFLIADVFLKILWDRGCFVFFFGCFFFGRNVSVEGLYHGMGSGSQAVNVLSSSTELCWAGGDVIKFSFPVGSPDQSVCLRIPCCGEFLVSR